MKVDSCILQKFPLSTSRLGRLRALGSHEIRQRRASGYCRFIFLPSRPTLQSCCEFEPSDTVHISSCHDVVAFLCQRVPNSVASGLVPKQFPFELELLTLRLSKNEVFLLLKHGASYGVDSVNFDQVERFEHPCDVQCAGED